MAGVIRKIIDKCVSHANDMYDVFLISHRRRTEIAKFKDTRRIEIYKTISLSEEQKNAIDDVYVKHYGERIPYTWHRHYTAFTGHFDSLFFPELLYIPEFEHFLNPNNDYVEVFGDKNVLPMIAKSVGVAMPKTLFSCVNGICRDENNVFLGESDINSHLSTLGKVFIKPSVDSNSGNGCSVVKFENDIDTLSGRRIEDIISELGKNYLVQECIECHESVKKLHPNSVNTFRIITYRWKDRIEHCPSILRIGMGNNVLDNAHAGGIFIGISDDGKLCSKAYTEFNRSYVSHPDTGVKFSEYEIPIYKDVLVAAERMHMSIPQIGLINWDFTISANGKPLLIEANTKGGGIWILQMAHGVGPFGDKTYEILEWMRDEKRKKLSERNK